MADQTAAASSPAEVDVFAGKELSFEEFSRYRKDPEKFTAEPAETAPADAPKEAQSEGDEPESAGEPEAPKETQEKKPHLTAEQRVSQLKATIEKIWSQDEPDTVKIAQLEATIDKIEARSGAKQRKTEPAPVAQPPQVQAQPQYTRPKPTHEDKNPMDQPSMRHTRTSLRNLPTGRQSSVGHHSSVNLPRKHRLRTLRRKPRRPAPGTQTSTR
jgi:hypothetical protein